MTASETQLDVAAARRALEELRQLERELEELRQIRRLDALERVREAVRRIGEMGSPEGILERAAEELARSSAFRRVLISQVRDGLLLPHAMWSADDDGERVAALLEQLAGARTQLEYPLVEHEVARRQEAEIVDVGANPSRSPRLWAEALGWSSYVVVALTLRGATVGMLHADAAPAARALDALDLEVAAIYAEGLAGAFERAALRKSLERHREELRTTVRWMSLRLEDSAAELDPGRRASAAGHGAEAAVETLTPREAEVLALMIGGHTNRSIATTLVISEGTVKYHVKNVLRKLGATSRADAVARYLGATE
jgi:DNA-binding CsgD family transcriptional regulator